jgi:hypothetical protein
LVALNHVRFTCVEEINQLRVLVLDSELISFLEVGLTGYDVLFKLLTLSVLEDLNAWL